MNFLDILLLIFPSYVANAVPVLLGNAIPIDNILGIKIFGKNKTLRGLIGGISAGVLVSYFLSFFTSLNPIVYIQIGILLSIGTMAGDLLGSFIKRLLRIKEGDPFFLDPILFIIFALALSFPLLKNLLTFYDIIFILILTYFLHIIMNRIANILGLKRVPW